MSDEDGAPRGDAASAAREPRGILVPAALIAGTVVVLLGGFLLMRRAESRTNHVALSASPKAVSVIRAKRATFRPTRIYVGTTEAWVAASVGPQFVSAYVDTVLVRPGDRVTRGEVLATLDCRNANAATRSIAMQARSLEAAEQAANHEASRVQGLLDGGFVSPNEAEKKSAESASQQAELLATQAKLLGATLEAGDCILRAPFDGEVSVRTTDPGAFVRPGSSIVTLVDRSVVRVSGNSPEVDFAVVAPGKPVSIHLLSTNQDRTGVVSRRAPSADDATRTVHFEVDVPNADRSIPVGTTAELSMNVGEPIGALQLPFNAATVRGEKVGVFVVENGVARARTAGLVGERGGLVYVDTALGPDCLVVTEGRALLENGDRVQTSLDVAEGVDVKGAPLTASSAAAALDGAP